ncbi:uncharacterized protein LOC111632949 [Centruroides sculpturatus]|uniref:uncharacterized protein LOC111632949 n=1 Tax=Centruroides sculpturatus TaxID=218467 RepID=UPI000C6E2143|nr:uncharacterized protein LOC111632949 [Centruroides sculpturatus]
MAEDNFSVVVDSDFVHNITSPVVFAEEYHPSPLMELIDDDEDECNDNEECVDIDDDDDDNDDELSPENEIAVTSDEFEWIQSKFDSKTEKQINSDLSIRNFGNEKSPSILSNKNEVAISATKIDSYKQVRNDSSTEQAEKDKQSNPNNNFKNYKSDIKHEGVFVPSSSEDKYNSQFLNQNKPMACYHNCHHNCIPNCCTVSSRNVFCQHEMDISPFDKNFYHDFSHSRISHHFCNWYLTHVPSRFHCWHNQTNIIRSQSISDRGACSSSLSPYETFPRTLRSSCNHDLDVESNECFFTDFQHPLDADMKKNNKVGGFGQDFEDTQEKLHHLETEKENLHLQVF